MVRFYCLYTCNIMVVYRKEKRAKWSKYKCLVMNEHVEGISKKKIKV